MPPPTASASYETDDDELFDELALASAERPRPRRRPLPWLRITLLSGVAIAGLVYLAQERQAAEGSIEPAPVPRAVLVAPPPLWQPISQPTPLYGIETADRKQPLAFEARRHKDGGREDTLLVGAFGEPGHGRITLARNIAGQEAGSLYIETVRRAAEAGLSVVRSAQSQMLASKFGAVEAAAMTLADTAEQACLAFRFAHPELGFGFRGWLCGADAKPVSPIQLACFIDRLSLVNGTDDPALKVLFAQADRQRIESCAPVARLDPPKHKAAPSRS